MRWFAYFILAYVTLGIQVGAGPYLRFQGASPNLVLLVVIFIAINAPKSAALMAAFFLGLLQDLLTQQQPGVYALSYGLVAMFVVSTQQVVYREHPLTHASLALVAGLMTACVVLLQGWLRPPGPVITEAGVPLSAIRPSPAAEFTRVLYTTVLSLLILGLLQRGKRIFAFQPPRRKLRAW